MFSILGGVWLRRSLGTDHVCLLGVRQQYARYKGPYFHQLTPEHLRQPPKAWLEFLCASKRGSDGVAYNLPLHISMLCERMEENMIFYLVRSHLPGEGSTSKRPHTETPLCASFHVLCSDICLGRAGKLRHDTGSLWATHTVSRTPDSHGIVV